MSAVVTGIGVVAPTGVGVDEYWRATLTGQCGIRRLTRFDPTGYPATLAGEVTGYRAEEHLPTRMLVQTDHQTRLALRAADLALADAGLDPDEPPGYDRGVVTAVSAGGFEFGQRELENLWARSPGHVSVYQSFAWFYAVNTGQVSIRHGMRGPGGVLVTDHAGGLDALGQARRQVRRGTPVVVSGGVDGALCPWGWVAQLAGGRISGGTDPRRAYLPFDARAAGYVPGEGGALLVVADGSGAGTRYAEIAGYAATFDPAPGTGGRPGLARALRLALDDANLAPSDVDVVFADAAGMPGADAAEADALREVFGPYGVPVTAPKAGTGRLAAGGAALDVATALLALRSGTVPPTPNVVADRRYQLDLVSGRARRVRPAVAAVVARGHGGFNAALVLRRDAAPTKGEE